MRDVMCLSTYITWLHMCVCNVPQQIVGFVCVYVCHLCFCMTACVYVRVHVETRG